MTARTLSSDEAERLRLLVDELDELCTAQIAGLSDARAQQAQLEIGQALMGTAVRMFRRSGTLKDPMIASHLKSMFAMAVDGAQLPGVGLSGLEPLL